MSGTPVFKGTRVPVQALLDHLEAGDSLNVGTALQSVGDLPAARQLLEQALASDLQDLGEDHPSVANRRSNLALVLMDLGDFPA